MNAALRARPHDACRLAAAVAGADEAGRGCLAGPLVAAAVGLRLRLPGAQADYAVLDAVDDSKKLGRLRRAEVSTARSCLRAGRSRRRIAARRPRIDGRGLHVCNLLALDSGPGPARARADGPVFVDGFALRSTARSDTEALIGGDGRCSLIAAASIVAKVTRDRLMLAVCTHITRSTDSPSTSAMTTPAHLEAIATHGVCALHRLSFAERRLRAARPGDVASRQSLNVTTRTAVRSFIAASAHATVPSAPFGAAAP